ncbi:MAG: sigma-70 family RNA polymerase sigma factor [Bacillota bacterium]
MSAADAGGGVVAAPTVEEKANPDEAMLRKYAETCSEEAFAEIVRRHAGWVYHICRRNLQDSHLAEDATQAVFLLLSRKAPSIKPGTHVAGWLFQACRYVLADIRKHRARYQRRQELARQMAVCRVMDFSHADASPDPELSEALDEAIAGLRESDRQAILMHFYEEMTLGQMAAQLGINHEAAKKRVTRALSRLRKRLAGKVRITGKGMAVPVAVVLLLLRARGAEAVSADLTLAVAKGATTPGFSSTLAEIMAEGVRQATIRITSRLLSTLAMTAVSSTLFIGMGLSLSSRDVADRGATPSRATAVPVRVAIAGDGANHTPAVLSKAAAAVSPLQPSPANFTNDALESGTSDLYRHPSETTAAAKPDDSAEARAEEVKTSPDRPADRRVATPPLPPEVTESSTGVAGAAGGAAGRVLMRVTRLPDSPQLSRPASALAARRAVAVVVPSSLSETPSLDREPGADSQLPGEHSAPPRQPPPRRNPPFGWWRGGFFVNLPIHWPGMLFPHGKDMPPLPADFKFGKDRRPYVKGGGDREEPSSHGGSSIAVLGHRDGRKQAAELGSWMRGFPGHAQKFDPDDRWGRDGIWADVHAGREDFWEFLATIPRPWRHEGVHFDAGFRETDTCRFFADDWPVRDFANRGSGMAFSSQEGERGTSLFTHTSAVPEPSVGVWAFLLSVFAMGRRRARH